MMQFSELSAGRANNFDFLRFFLATSVLFTHCYPLLYGPGHNDPISNKTHGQLSGAAAVGFFFLISGFLVTQSRLGSRSTADYFRKRLLRIYPAFIVVSFFCAFIVGPLGAEQVSTYFQHLNIIKFLGYIVLLVGPFIPPTFAHLPYAYAVDGSFWTLRYEFWCYVLVAIFSAVGLLKFRLFPLLIFCIILVLGGIQDIGHHVLFPDHDYRFIGNPVHWYGLLIFFLAGMVFYLYQTHIPYSNRLALLALAIVIVSMPLSLGMLSLPTCGSYLLFYLAFHPSLKLQKWGKHGDFSYGIYLYAFPIQQLLIQYFGKQLTPLTLFVAAFAITTMFAALSWHFVEKPCLKLKALTR